MKEVFKMEKVKKTYCEICGEEKERGTFGQTACKNECTQRDRLARARCYICKARRFECCC